MNARRSCLALPKNGSSSACLGQFGDIFELPIDLDRFKMGGESGNDRLTTQNLPSFFDCLAIKYDSGDVSAGTSSMLAGDFMLSKPSSGPLVATSRLGSAAACVETSSMIFRSGCDDFRAFESNMQVSFAAMFYWKSFRAGWADSSQTVKDPYGTLIDRMVLC